MTYKVTLFGKTETLNIAQFRHVSQHFALKYLHTPSPPLLDLLHAIHLPMLKAHRLWDTAYQTDLNQQFLFHLKHALAKWQPSRSPFLHFLKYAVRECWREYIEHKPPPAITIEEDHRISPSIESPDPILWQSLAQGLSKLDFEILTLRSLEELTMLEIASRLRIPIKELRLHWKALELKARQLVSSSAVTPKLPTLSTNGKTLHPSTPTGEFCDFKAGAWVPLQRFYRFPGVSSSYWTLLMDAGRVDHRDLIARPAPLTPLIYAQRLGARWLRPRVLAPTRPRQPIPV